ncbi:MAG TPA: endoribonuclease MazF [Synergistales bacterium]|nr:endoribonuclease MazF [Synergistales bacterium]
MVSDRSEYVPDQGDMVWLNFNPASGHEQKGRRPAVVITPQSYNRASGLCFVLPVTSKEKGYPFEVPLTGVNGTHGVILTDQGRTVDWKARQAVKIESLPEDIMGKVKVLLKTLMGLD